MPKHDSELLQSYVQSGDSDAFAELARRYVDTVYSSARRQVGDANTAEEVTQAVFILLSRKAGSITGGASLPGWLLKVTWFAARDAIKARARQHKREQAMDMSVHPQPARGARDAWQQISPVLDEAMAGLGDIDRGAILLRFMEQKSVGEVAQALNLSAGAAGKRISRALLKLRRLLVRRGITLAPELLGTALAYHAHIAAPQALHTVLLSTTHSSAAVGLAKGTVTAMAIAKIKAAAIAAVLVLIAVPAGVIVVQYRALAADNAAPAPIAPAATSQPEDASSSAPRYTSYYGPKGGAVLNRVTPPAEIRDEYYQREIVPQLLEHYPPKLKGQLQNQKAPKSMILFSNKTFATSFSGDYTFGSLLESMLDVYSQDIEGNGEDFLMPGDYVCNSDATNEQRRAALEQIVQLQFDHPLSLRFRDVSRAAIVLRGNWSYSRVKSPRVGNAQIPAIELYDLRINEKFNGMGLGDAHKLANEVGKWLGKDVVIECPDFPPMILWSFNESTDKHPADPSHILEHLKEQTGLVSSIEQRTVHHLFLEPIDAKQQGL